jgi:hypothetical protein
MRLRKDPELYKETTKKLLAKIDALHLAPEKRQKAIHFVQLFRESFTKEEVKKASFLANPENDRWDLGYDSGGFCRMASITFMFVMDFHDWQLMAIPEGKWKYGHHWLVHKETGEIFDLTYDQFVSKIPYEIGEPASPSMTLQDETHAFAKSVGIDLLKTIIETKGK